MFYFAVGSYCTAHYDLTFKAGKTIRDHSGDNWEMATFITLGHIFWFRDCLWFTKEDVDYLWQHNKAV